LRADVANAGNERQLLVAARFQSLEAGGDIYFLLGNDAEAFGMIDADGGFALQNALLDI
jgi:hypothetical protein